ncbi:esterase/lipase family protein [Corynebacterium suicordis]|uniref:Alpha/beta fold hydrolase n=1 Tax=Corynebacterium suicordis DSM 45110 TaxID=1121369 RepID=A0ABR9ZHH7_9CORY|nr:alpha/beta fold hydrolase [Corynebacterium suicordis]MBF4552832.1 alpha/beta fold hydrolase [Corynebacterium suicordis DSM 45110]MDR6278209.1 triacylglycerol esterase/lipase EstA (alpha/beta hydrolase family) [Corynebacterium suicordis]
MKVNANPTTFLPAFFRSLHQPDALPVGVNKWDEPLDGRVPIVLVHGTWLNVYNTFGMIAPALSEAGHAVFTQNYGHDSSSFTGRPSGVFGTAPMLEAQKEVASFIDAVLERTGASQVDLIGHSQGVAQTRLYLTESGGADPDNPANNKVRQVIGIAGSNHGTTLSGVGSLTKWLDKNGRFDNFGRRVLGQAALDQRLGSEAVKRLNEHGDTVPGVKYTMICSRFDQIVTPWRSQILHSEDESQVKNILVQTGNIKDYSDHLAILYSPKVIDLILEAVHPGPDDYRDTHPEVTGWVIPGFGRAPRVASRLPFRSHKSSARKRG